MTNTLLTARIVAERLGVSIAWVLQHASARRLPVLPSIKIGRVVRFREADVDAFVERCTRRMEKGLPLQ